MTKVAYITSSQFSGSTLTSFILNLHPKIATVGHAMGWSFNDEETFYCSCGSEIRECKFYQYIKNQYENNYLEFKFNNFGTKFQLSKNDRINNLLTKGIPIISNNGVEKLRNNILCALPIIGNKIKIQAKSNHVLFEGALSYYDANVFLDNSHCPYRLRLLNTSDYFQIKPIYLIRDPRGVICSMITNNNWDLETSINKWVSQQLDIIRILKDFPDYTISYYEDLCIDTNSTLKKLYGYLGIDHHEFNGNFKEEEHHILGNRMRLQNGQLKHDQRWKKDLTNSDVYKIESSLTRIENHQNNKIFSDIILNYFN